MFRTTPVPRDPRSLQALAPPPPPDLTFPEILQEAVAWQEEAEAVIELCVLPGGKTQALARRAGLVITVYRVLREALAALPRSPEHELADRLLDFHRKLLEQVLLLGFRPDSAARERVASHCRGGLASPGAQLRRLYRQVQELPEGGGAQT